MIDLAKIYELIRQKWLFLIFIVGFFITCGVVYIILAPKVYFSSVSLLPEPKGGTTLNAGILSQFSSVPGLGSLGGTMEDAIRPELYPVIVTSKPFIKSLLSHTFWHPDYKDTVNLLSYTERYAPSNHLDLIRRYTIGLPSTLISLLRQPYGIMGDSLISESIYFKPDISEFRLLKNVADQVKIDIDKKTGLINVGVFSTDAFISAELTNFAKDYIIKYVTDYKLRKRLNSVTYLTSQAEKLESEFLKNQKQYTDFKERNLNLASPRIQSLEENYLASYQLSKELYFSVSGQLQQAKLKLNEEFPVFLEVEPVFISPLKSKPETMLILAFTFLLGVLVAALYLLFLERYA